MPHRLQYNHAAGHPKNQDGEKPRAQPILGLSILSDFSKSFTLGHVGPLAGHSPEILLPSASISRPPRSLALCS